MEKNQLMKENRMVKKNQAMMESQRMKKSPTMLREKASLQRQKASQQRQPLVKAVRRNLLKQLKRRKKSQSKKKQWRMVPMQLQLRVETSEHSNTHRWCLLHCGFTVLCSLCALFLIILLLTGLTEWCNRIATCAQLNYQIFCRLLSVES